MKLVRNFKKRKGNGFKLVQLYNTAGTIYESKGKYAVGVTKSVNNVWDSKARKEEFFNDRISARKFVKENRRI